MLALYVSELRRFRIGAAICAVTHLIVLAVLQQSLALTTAPMGVHLAMLVFYMLAGCAFAVFQFGSYRRPGRWIWLMHRPVSRGRILAALVLTALTLTVLAVALPQCLVLAAQDPATHIVDRRHYAGAVCLALAALAGWMGGGWVMLHQSRWASLVFLLPFILSVQMATAGTVIALWLLCDAAMLVMLYTVFRPDRAADAGTPAVIPGAIMLQAGFAIAAMFLASLLFFADRQVTRHAPRAAIAASYSDTMRMRMPDRMALGLSGSAEPRADAWRAALARAGVRTIAPIRRDVAVPHLVSNRGVMTFIRGEETWTFSEDARMYHGVNMRTGTGAGWFGTGGVGATGGFETQPLAMRDTQGQGWMLDLHDLYAVDGSGAQLHKAFSVAPGEYLASGVTWTSDERLLLTNGRVILFDPASPALKILGTLVLPLPFRDLGAVDVVQVADGTLVSLLYGYRQNDNGGPAGQWLYLFDHAGGVREVSRRTMAHDTPALAEHRAWWISPVLHVITGLPGMLVDTGAIPDNGAVPLAALAEPRPAVAWEMALAAMLCSGAAGLWWVRRTPMPRGARVAWSITCLMVGVPAFLALMVAAPRTVAARRSA